MTMAKNVPVASIKPMLDKFGRDIRPSFIRSALKKVCNREQKFRILQRIKREIGTLPGRKRNGYCQQVVATYAVMVRIMSSANLATGYVYTSLTELANETNTKTVSENGSVGMGRVRAALKTLKALGYIDYVDALFDPVSGGRDCLHIVTKPSFYSFAGTRESVAVEHMKKALMKETAKQKKASENGRGLPPETLDALADPKKAACLIGWWQWYGYTKTTFRRFFLNVRRAGLHILPPADVYSPDVSPG